MKRVSDVAYEATLTALECGATMLSTRSAELRRNGRPERAGTYARHAAEFRTAKAGLEHGTTSGGGASVAKDVIQGVIDARMRGPPSCGVAGARAGRRQYAASPPRSQGAISTKPGLT